MRNHSQNDIDSISLFIINSILSIEEAIAEEKRIKAGSVSKKETLINALNPTWEDLYEKEVKYW